MRVLHIADPDCPETKTGYVNIRPAGLLCAADHPAQPVEWLWQHRIPLGKVTLLAGDPGLGKSLLALDIAARVTRGDSFPTPCASPPFASSATTNSTNSPHHTACGTQYSVPSTPHLSTPCGSAHPTPHSLPPAPCPLLPASVLVLSASDDFADTIRPRLEAAGADLKRVFTESAITDLRHDFAELKAVLDEIPDCRLIIVDPVSAFVGPGDSHYHTVVRRVLLPLTRLAAERRIAILAITQFRKNDGATIHRAAGSTGFVAAARSLWTVSRDPRDSTRNLFLPIKQNLTHAARGLAYRILESPTAEAPYIHWEPETEVLSTEAAFARPKQPRESSPERAAARRWLAKILAAGPRPTRLIFAEGRQFGFLERTLQRAFQELGGSTAKRGLVEGWWWALEKEGAPSESAVASQPDDDTPPKTPDVFEGVTYEEDIAQGAELDALLVEPLTRYLREPTLKESMAALNRRARERTRDSESEPDPQTVPKAKPRPKRTPEQDAQPDPIQLTGHPVLDQFLKDVRAELRTAQTPTAPMSGGGHHEVGGSACSSGASPTGSTPTNSHPQHATKAAATTHRHKSRSHGSTTQSPAPTPPHHPKRAPGSSAGSS